MEIGSNPLSTQDNTASDIIENFSKILGVDETSGLDIDDSLLDMGADSLALMKCVDFLQDNYQVTLSNKDFYQDLLTLADVIDFVSKSKKNTPPSIENTSQTAPLKRESFNMKGTSDIEWVKELIQSQTMLMERHILVLEKMEASSQQKDKQAEEVFLPTNSSPDTDRAQTKDRFNVFDFRKNSKTKLSDLQTAYIKRFIDEYVDKHATSKELTQQARSPLADNRASAGFKPDTKEILFPILSESAEGAYIWDVDGNKYVDITMGFGVHLLGHNPSFIKDAIAEQLKMGFPVGPQSPKGGELAKLVCEFTGHDRVLFCNSGTEATMTALRLARAYTKRRKVVIFRESYHGTFDGFLARSNRSRGDEHGSIPVSEGTTQSAITDTVVLEFDDPDALSFIELNAAELAAVIVEPVQSRRPGLQPKEFLEALRKVTTQHDIVFIWDEVITGFRAAPGGAQEYFGVRADLATYGKVVGGGMPIGIVAGNESILDYIDGGYWEYGNNSMPMSDQIFFAGTFNKHPLTMCASLATLKHLRDKGPSLQQELTKKTLSLVTLSNEIFSAENIPIKVECFGSLFRYTSKKNIDLFFSHMMNENVFIWEGRNCFLSTAHSDDDLRFILDATQRSITKLKSGGFFNHDLPEISNKFEMSLWQNRFCELWTDSSELALNIGGGLLVQGITDNESVAEIQKSVDQYFEHETAFSVTFDKQKKRWARNAARVEAFLLRANVPENVSVKEVIKSHIDSEMVTPFRVSDEVQCRVTLLDIEANGVVVIVVANHAVCDGYSFGVMVESIVHKLVTGDGAESRQQDIKSQGMLADKSYVNSSKFKEDDAFWAKSISQWQEKTQFTEFPAHTAEKAERIEFEIEMEAVKKLSQRIGVSRFSILLQAFNASLSEISSISELGVVGVPFANRSLIKDKNAIAQLANILPVLLHSDDSVLGFDQSALEVSELLNNYKEHQAYPVLSVGGYENQPRVAVSLNLEPGDLAFPSEQYRFDIFEGTRPVIEFPIEINIRELRDVFKGTLDFQAVKVEATAISELLKTVNEKLHSWSENNE